MKNAWSRLDLRLLGREIAERIDRRSLVGAFAVGLMFTTWGLVLMIVMRPEWRTVMAFTAALTLRNVLGTMVALVLFAVAAVAVTRGVPAWLGYPVALLLAVVVFYAGGLMLFSWLAPHRSNATRALTHSWAALFMFGMAGTFYVHAGNAARDARLLRAAEAERAMETERLAHEQLQAQLASIDHDLVITAMRLALVLRAHEPDHADELLTCVTEYLRAAQQRGGTDAQRIAKTLMELRHACTTPTATSREG